MQILLISFIVLTVVSGLGIAFLYLCKNPKVKTSLFYFLAILSMLIAFSSASSQPTNYVAPQLIAWGIGFIAVVAIVVRIVVKNTNSKNISNHIVSFSVLAGLITLFFV